ncbi:MAG: zinc-ribbon domain-containing protein [Promethearchaeota archaeon]
MLKRLKVKTGYLLLAVLVLLLVLPIVSGLMQPLPQEQRIRTTNYQTSGLKLSSFDRVAKGFQTDDNYEPNDNMESAYDLTDYEQTWLSEIDGYGVQWDDDWYEIYISSGNSHLDVQLTFTHALGDIDIRVVDTYGGTVDSSTSVSDNEYIDIDIAPGTYYLEVYYDDEGNSYDLWWDDSVSGTTPTGTPFLPTFSPFVLFIGLIIGAGMIIVIVVVVVIVIVVRISTRPSYRTRPRPRPPTAGPPRTGPPTAGPPRTGPPIRGKPTTKCPNCGSPIEPGDKFCVGCGKEVNK